MPWVDPGLRPGKDVPTQKEEFSIFTYVGSFRQITIGTELVAQVRQAVLREGSQHYEMTVRQKGEVAGNWRPGVKCDHARIAPRDMKIFEKYGHFSATFLAQYEYDFANPGLAAKLAKDVRVLEGGCLDEEAVGAGLEGLELDYERLRFG
jgi:hypothetical protein